MTRFRFILVSFFAAVAGCLGWRRRAKPELIYALDPAFGHDNSTLVFMEYLRDQNLFIMRSKSIPRR